jgi:ABC-2 type transport system ATP-binding protein
MIRVRNLRKSYGPVLAVDGIDLDANKGQVVGLLGPNGAGKSTTLRILTGFMPPTSGTAQINGHDVMTHSKQVRQSLGYLPESTPLYGELTVEQQLHHFGRLHGVSRAVRRQRIAELAERCGLSQIIRRPIGHLSKGNRQRVGLAQALVHDPPLLILDEPTAGLDPAQITEVRRLIQDLGQTKCILLSTHILPEVEKTCDQVIILHQGRVAASGTPQELKANVRMTARVLIEVQTEASQLQTVLSGLNCVGQLDVQQEGVWAIAAVRGRQGDQDIRANLAEAVTEKGWAIREIRHEAASLEEFFIQITSGQDAGAA